MIIILVMTITVIMRSMRGMKENYGWLNVAASQFKPITLSPKP